jgi:hypothetical protein
MAFKKMYMDMKLNLIHLKTFFYLAYIHVLVDKKPNCKHKQRNVSLICYDGNSKTYCCYEPTIQKIVVTKEVTFDEFNLGLQGMKDPLLSLGTCIVTRLELSTIKHDVQEKNNDNGFDFPCNKV